MCGGGGGRRGRSRWSRCESRPLPRAPPAPHSARRPHHPRYFPFCYRVNVRPGGGGARNDGRPRPPIAARGAARRRGGDVICSQWGGRGDGPAPRGSRCSPRTAGGGPVVAPPTARAEPPQDGQRPLRTGSNPRQHGQRPGAPRVRPRHQLRGPAEHRPRSRSAAAAGSAARPPQPRRGRLGSERAAPTREDAA